MARIRRPGEDPVVAPPARERDRQRNRGNTRNRGGGSGLSQSAGNGVSPPTTPGTTTAFAIQDPAAWARSNIAAAGFGAVNDPTEYGAFLQSAVVQPFVAGWQQWQATHPSVTDQNFWDYAKGTNSGLPDAVTGGPPAAPGSTPEVMSFNAFSQQQTGKNKNQLGKHRRNRIHSAYDEYVAGQQPTGTPQAVPSTLSPEQWAAYRATLQNTIDAFTPQQQGRFDSAKRPGSIRTNLFS